MPGIACLAKACVLTFLPRAVEATTSVTLTVAIDASSSPLLSLSTSEAVSQLAAADLFTARDQLVRKLQAGGIYTNDISIESAGVSVGMSAGATPFLSSHYVNFVFHVRGLTTIMSEEVSVLAV